MSDRGFFLTLHAVQRQLAAMPNDFYFVRMIHRLTRKPSPGERIWDAGLLTRGSVVRFLRARNLQGHDIYLLPYAEHRNAGYILLDLDHAIPEILPRMRANGHEPCVILQTSPGHLQAWIRVSTTPLEPAVATSVSKQLAHTYGGDLASTDWRHLGRLAGFTNQKFACCTPSGSAPWVKVVETCPILASAAQDLLRSAMQALAQQSTAAPPHRIDPGRHVGQQATMTAQGAARIYRTWMKRWHIQERFPQNDWSIVDLWLARKLLAMHISPTQVEAILRLGSPNFPRRHGDAVDYLRRTLAAAALPIPTPSTVCSIPTTIPRLVHAAAPRARREPGDSDCSNSRGGR